jgi:hypothetical protein
MVSSAQAAPSVDDRNGQTKENERQLPVIRFCSGSGEKFFKDVAMFEQRLMLRHRRTGSSIVRERLPATGSDRLEPT